MINRLSDERIKALLRDVDPLGLYMSNLNDEELTSLLTELIELRSLQTLLSNWRRTLLQVAGLSSTFVIKPNLTFKSDMELAIDALALEKELLK